MTVVLNLLVTGLSGVYSQFLTGETFGLKEGNSGPNPTCWEVCASNVGSRGAWQTDDVRSSDVRDRFSSDGIHDLTLVP